MTEESGGSVEEKRFKLEKSLQELIEIEEKLLAEAKGIIKESVSLFVDKKIGLLFKLVPVYKDVLIRHGVETRAGFERYIQRFYRYPEIQEAAHDWHDVEREWDDLLSHLDKKLDSGGGVLMKEGDLGPVEETLEEFSDAGSRVVLISFGVKEGAEKWLKDNSCSFDMLLDEERIVYKAFSLKRSVLKVWSVSSLLYYAEKLVAGVELPAPYKDIEDDPHQMGGDFILDKDGKAKLIYRSKTSRDRPTVDALLKALKEMNS